MGVTFLVPSLVPPRRLGVTENYNWRWVFYLHQRPLRDPSHSSHPSFLPEERSASRVSISSALTALSVGVAAFQIMLDRAN